MSTDATTGARDRKEWSSLEKARAPRPVESARCAEAWGPTCPCGWALSPPCTLMQEPPPTPSFPAVTSAQRGQSGTGQRLPCPTGLTHSDLSAPSALLPSATPAGRGSSSRAPSTNRYSLSKHYHSNRKLPLLHSGSKCWWVTKGNYCRVLLSKHACFTLVRVYSYTRQCFVLECSSVLKNLPPCLSFSASRSGGPMKVTRQNN